MVKGERKKHCPLCGGELIRSGADVECYRNLGITIYDTCCKECKTVIGIEDRSNYEQEGKITILFN